MYISNCKGQLIHMKGSLLNSSQVKSKSKINFNFTCSFHFLIFFYSISRIETYLYYTTNQEMAIHYMLFKNLKRLRLART